MSTNITSVSTILESQDPSEPSKIMEPLLDPELDLLHINPPGTAREKLCMMCVYTPCVCILTLLEERIGELQAKEQEPAIRTDLVDGDVRNQVDPDHMQVGMGAAGQEQEES